MQRATAGHQRAANDTMSECGSHHPHGPTAEDWDAVRHVIQELYVYEHWKLRDVRHHLETNYNFRATYGTAIL